MREASVYATLVARFAIPLTTVKLVLSTEPRVQLWTQGHVVHAVGEEHGRPLIHAPFACNIALFPQQFQVLDETPDDPRHDDVMILHGPPGTAKTIVLVLRGEQWLRKPDCRTVFVLQTSDDGTAAAHLVRHQLSETVGQEGSSVHVDMIRAEEGRACVDQLCQAAFEEGRVHILADEADCDVIAKIYRTLKQRQVKFSLWAAGVNLKVPADMKRYVRCLTQPLRCPPSVRREVERANAMKDGTVPAYTCPHAPCDGPPPVTLTHYKRDIGGHRGRFPWNCSRCGEEVANILLRQLRVGCHGDTPRGQGGLTFSDVFVLADGVFMTCDTHDSDGRPVPDDHWQSPARFIRGLQARGVPTRKVSHKDTAAVRQLAEMASAATHRDLERETGGETGGERETSGERETGVQREAGISPGGVVTVAQERTVWGLERKVIVYLDIGGGGRFTAYADRTGRLYAMSRATAQIIWVMNVRQ